MSVRADLHDVLDVIAARERDAGAVHGWVHKGEYGDWREPYQRGHVVRMGGSTYVAVADTPGECPQDGWQLVAEVGARGATGEQGPQGDIGKAGQPGPPGAIGPPGRSIRWRGRYRPFTRYNTDDVVHYNLALWIALQPTEHSPLADQVNWDLVIRFDVPNLDEALHRMDQLEIDVAALQQWDIDHLAALDPHPQYLLPEDLPQTAATYLSAGLNPDYPADYSLLVTPSGNPSAAITTPVNGDAVLCGTFVRYPPLQQDILYAELEMRVVLDIEGEINPTFVHVELWLRKGDTSPSVFLGESAVSYLQDTRGTYTFIIQILGPVEAVAGDYTYLNVLGTKDGTGAERTVTIYVDGDNVSRALTFLPIPAYPAAHGPSHSPGGTDEIPGLLSEADAIQVFAFAAYGGMRMDAPTAFPDLGAAWQTLNVFDAANPSTPRGVSVNPATGEFAYEHEGLYVISLTGAFEHNSDNNGRITQLRIFDVTGGAALGSALDIPTGRNSEATSVASTFFIEIPAGNVNDVLRFEIGNGNAYTAVVFNALSFATWNVGEWREPLPSETL